MIFTGQQPAREIPGFVQACDVLVSPRIRGTNTPLKIYSYLRSGKPIVATDLLTHTQVLTPEIALLVAPEPEPFAAAMLALHRQPRARERCRRAGARASREEVQPRGLRCAARGRSYERLAAAAAASDSSRRAHEGARDRRDRLHRWPSAQHLAAAAATTVRGAGAADEPRALRSLAAGSDGRRDRVEGDLTDAAAVRAPPMASRSCITSPRPIAKRGSRTRRIARSTSTARATCSRPRARPACTRVVHCSTGGVHGHIANPPANEDAPFNPGDVYQETKLEAEQLAREFGASNRPRRRRGAADRHLRPGRHALPEDVSRPRARPLPDARLGPGRSTT